MLADVTLAFRRLAQSPAFTFVALLTLAVGIGSATVVFSAVNALFLRPVPLLDPATEDRLLYATEVNPGLGFDRLGWNYADYTSLRQRSQTLAGLLVHCDRTVILSGSREPERLFGTEMSWDAFAILGVQPLLGRSFTAADAVPGAPEVALISHSLWQRRFASDPAVMGTSVTMNGQPVTVIGVMPPAWRYPEVSDVWSVMRLEGEKLNRHGYYWLEGRARLKPGVTLAEAQAEVSAVMAAMAQEHPQTNRGVGVRLQPIREEAIERTGPSTLLLFGAVLFVFLIACLNVANLLLSRGAARVREFALRLALGATRGHLLRQLCTESLLLGLAGAAGGLVLALWGVDAMVEAIPVELPFWLSFDFDLRVFLFAFTLGVFSVVIFGVVPALRASRPDLVGELKEGGRTTEPGGLRSQRLRHTLVVTEVALALVLLVGAGLMMRSFLHLQRTERGYEPENILTFRTGFPASLFGEDYSLPAQFFADLTRRLRALPGVTSAGVVSLLPGSDDGVNGYLLEEGKVAEGAGEAPLAITRHADDGYFRALQIPMLAGRSFDDALDRFEAPRVALVDERFAIQNFGSAAAALGRRLKPWGPPAEKTLAPSMAAEEPGVAEHKTSWTTIVGVVGNVRHRADLPNTRPTIYYPQSQLRSNFLSVVVRTQGDPLAWSNAVREATLATNPNIPIYYVRSLREVETRAFWQVGFFTRLFVVFGLIALLLACVGIYGVMAYHVSLRTRELGLRLVLGAQPGEVVGMVVQHGLLLVGLGLVAGLAAALLLAEMLTAVLHGVSPYDAPTFAAVPLVLAAVAVLACWLPSRRAIRLNPAEVFRAN